MIDPYDLLKTYMKLNNLQVACFIWSSQIWRRFVPEQTDFWQIQISGNNVWFPDSTLFCLHSLIFTVMLTLLWTLLVYSWPNIRWITQAHIIIILEILYSYYNPCYLISTSKFDYYENVNIIILNSTIILMLFASSLLYLIVNIFDKVSSCGTGGSPPSMQRSQAQNR